MKLRKKCSFSKDKLSDMTSLHDDMSTMLDKSVDIEDYNVARSDYLDKVRIYMEDRPNIKKQFAPDAELTEFVIKFCNFHLKALIIHNVMSGKEKDKKVINSVKKEIKEFKKFLSTHDCEDDEKNNDYDRYIDIPTKLTGNRIYNTIEELIEKVETFMFNLENKIIPMAQSLLLSHSSHLPTAFIYQKNGIEKIADFTDLFSMEDKEVIYKVFKNFLEESNTVAYVLVTEAYMTKVPKNMSDKEIEEILHSGIAKQKKEEVLVFQYDFRHGDVRKSGTINYTFKNNSGNIVIDYDNPIKVDDSSGLNSFSRVDSLLD